MKQIFNLGTVFLLAYFIAACSRTTPMISEEFEISSKDQLTKLKGEINYRGYEGTKRPAVIIIHGTGPNHRDGTTLMLQSADRSEANAFKLIAERLTKEGYAVVRFDTRAVKCAIECPHCKDEAKSWLEKCIDQELALTEDMETIVDDIHSVYQYARMHPGLDSDRFSFVTHSAGLPYTAKLLDQNRIDIKAIVALSGHVQSTADLVSWQNTIGHVEAAKRCDKNRDGLLTKPEIEGCSNQDRLSGPVLGVDEKGVRIKEIETTWLDNQRHYLQRQSQIWNDNKKELWRKPSTPPGIGAFGFLIEMANGKKPVIDSLSSAGIRTFFYWGGKDPLFDIPRQIEIVKKSLDEKGRFVVREYPNLGHAMGPDQTAGPIAAEVIDQIAKDLNSAMESLANDAKMK
jgi:dienelactone hydrolase